MQTRTPDAAMTAGMATAGTAAVPEGAPALPPQISWGAVFAGGIVAITIGAMLNILGLAVGVSTVDATVPGGTPSASTFGVVGGIWMLVANLIGLAVGGYVGAWLSGTSDDTDGMLHGLSVWAIAFLISAVLLGNVIAGATSTAFQGVSTMVSGAARGAGQAAQAAASQVDPQQVVERAEAALRGGAGRDPAQMTSEQRNAEIAAILTRSVTQPGPLPQDQRDRLTQLTAAEYNITPAEAQTRLQQVEQQASQTARQAADTAATATAVAAYWIFATMLLGAAVAVLGARLGTRGVVRVAARRYA